MIELNKLKISTRKQEAELLVKNNGVDPDISQKTAACSLGGVIVKTFQVSISIKDITNLNAELKFLCEVCAFCEEEFCCGSSCGLFLYEDVKVTLELDLHFTST